jgi:putative flippase GtrA
MSVWRQFLSFGMVGVIGFLIDAGVLYLAIAFGLGLYLGRALSYLVAVTATWILNRRYTFRQSASNAGLWRQWARFGISQLSGATVNLGSYALLVHWVPLVARHPVLGVAAGSLSGLVVNFSVARMYVFSHRRQPPSAARDLTR